MKNEHPQANLERLRRKLAATFVRAIIEDAEKQKRDGES